MADSGELATTCGNQQCSWHMETLSLCQSTLSQYTAFVYCQWENIRGNKSSQSVSVKGNAVEWQFLLLFNTV